MDIELKINKVDTQATENKEIKQIVDLINEVNQQAPVNKDIEDIFIDENDLFNGDDVSPEDKIFMMDIIDKTNFVKDRGTRRTRNRFCF